MKKWKYKRRLSKRTKDSQDDKRCLASHHLDVPGKYKARNAKQSAKMARQEYRYEGGTTVIYSSQITAKGVSKWVRSKSWFSTNREL